MAESMGEKGLLKGMLALSCLLALVSIAALAGDAAGEDGPGIEGDQPPFFGDWFIAHDTNVTGMDLSFPKNVYVASRINLVIRDSRINIEYDAQNPHQYIFRVETAAVVTVINSTLVLDTFAAVGQAALTFQNGSRVTTTDLLSAVTSWPRSCRAVCACLMNSSLIADPATSRASRTATTSITATTKSPPRCTYITIPPVSGP